MCPEVKDKVLSALQVEIFIDEYILRKEQKGPGITKEHKKPAWVEIVEALQQACPDEPTYDIKDTKKKFCNIKAMANSKIAEYSRSLKETGGGTVVILKPFDLKC
ncbi:Uncharacterized protein APZ42_003650 [Daphnia magna]|uniref:Regulatory protein zeste n=1 Tax=Daphnia magna TaxID=35525 RepID=A0A168ELE3_9CRUS|nr:Uncharacterized protein APZ42_003650 [Daphnia magna]